MRRLRQMAAQRRRRVVSVTIAASSLAVNVGGVVVVAAAGAAAGVEVKPAPSAFSQLFSCIGAHSFNTQGCAMPLTPLQPSWPCAAPRDGPYPTSCASSSSAPSTACASASS